MICIVIPALNEEDRLRALLPLIPRRLLGMPIVVVVVSDGSSDRTTDVATAGGSNLVVLGTSCGKGAALRAGLQRARELGYDFLVTMDGDGQHDPEDLEELIRPVAGGECDASFGSRYLATTGRGRTPLNRYLVRKATVIYLKHALGLTFTDPFCGYRCFSRVALESINFVGDGYHCELETIFDGVKRDLKIKEVPVRRIYGSGTSKMGVRGGKLLGRARVVGEYLLTVRNRSRELR